MSDIFSKEKRSKVMGLVKGKNTKPEMILRKGLHSLGFRFRIHDKKLPGNPDIKLTKYKTIIFVNGCFWHGHADCKNYTIPKSNNTYWINKLKENVVRDNINYKKLNKLGWEVLIIWTCELKKSKLNETIAKISKKLTDLQIDTQAHK